MKIKLINHKLEDFIVLNGTLKEIQAEAKVEMARRGWKDEDCSSCEIS